MNVLLLKWRTGRRGRERRVIVSPNRVGNNGGSVLFTVCHPSRMVIKGKSTRSVLKQTLAEWNRLWDGIVSTETVNVFKTLEEREGYL